MMNKESNDRVALIEKIDALFVYRKLPFLIEQGGASESEQKSLTQKLFDLQVSIYDLDTYLESNWVLKVEQIDFWWQPIYTAMTALGVPSNKQEDFLTHIKKYQKHEMQLREGKYPSRLEMEYFYFYKSCDVKLLRRIIYSHYPSLRKRYTLADWRTFDLVTEIDDDVEDVYEDQGTINGNRFLIGICHEGLDVTVKQYLQFMQEVKKAIHARFEGTTNQYQKELKSWTLLEWEKTNERIIKTHKDCKDINLTLKF